jgi:hypothetical protein
MGSRPLAMIAAALLALVAGTCQSDDDADDTSPTTDRTTTTVSPEAEVEAAYLAFWDMAVRLAGSPNPDDPEIAQRASGDALADLVDGLHALRTANQRTDSGPTTGHDVLAVEVDGDRAHLDDCAVDESRLVDVDTGETKVEATTTTRWAVTAIRRDGRWLVDQFERTDAWEGAVACE